MASPIASVVMSVFNGETFLAEAIESILNQTFRNFEFVIIDDGSTDKTAEIISNYAKADGRIRVFSQGNRGRAESLNRGIDLSRGLYIVRMDADDVAMPSRVEEQIGFLDKHPTIGLLGGACQAIDARGQGFETILCPLEDSEIRMQMRLHNPMCHPAVVMRKNLALESGGYRKALQDADDFDLWLRVAERTQLANLENVVLRYRIHRGQVTIRNFRHQTLCVLAARAAASARARGDPDPLCGIQEITQQVVAALGVPSMEINETLLRDYRYWIDLLRRADPESALEFMDGLFKLLHSERFKRRELSDTWLDAAGIHYKQRRLLKALYATGCGVLARPIVAGRPIKRVFVHLEKTLRS